MRRWVRSAVRCCTTYGRARSLIRGLLTYADIDTDLGFDDRLEVYLSRGTPEWADPLLKLRSWGIPVQPGLAEAEDRYVFDAEVAETSFSAFTGRPKAVQVTCRLVVRRVRRMQTHGRRRLGAR